MQNMPRRKNFEFQNIMTTTDGYLEAVSQNWRQPLAGFNMMNVWRNLQRLQKVIKEISQPFKGIKSQIDNTREKLKLVQEQLIHDKQNEECIMEVKSLTEEVIRLNNIEENVLQQRSKVEWLKLEGGNNRFFYASLQNKLKQNKILAMTKEDGDALTTQDDFEAEVLRNYGQIVGSKVDNLKRINIVTLRQGKQLSVEQREML